MPPEVNAYIDHIFRSLVARIFSELTSVIEEYDDGPNKKNTLSAQLYLEHKIPPNVNRIDICLTEKETKVSLFVEKNEEIVDSCRIKWRFGTKPAPEHEVHNKGNTMVKPQVQGFELRFHKKHKGTILGNNIPHVLRKISRVKQAKNTLKLFTSRSYRGEVSIEGE